MNATPYYDWVDGVLDGIPKCELDSPCVNLPNNLLHSHGIRSWGAGDIGEVRMAPLSMARLSDMAALARARASDASSSVQISV